MKKALKFPIITFFASYTIICMLCLMVGEPMPFLTKYDDFIQSLIIVAVLFSSLIAYLTGSHLDKFPPGPKRMIPWH